MRFELFQDHAGHSPPGTRIFSPHFDELHAELQQHGALLLQQILRRLCGNRDVRVNDYSGNEISSRAAGG